MYVCMYVHVLENNYTSVALAIVIMGNTCSINILQ